MRPTQGYDQAQAMDGSGFPTLPPGGYVCEIKGAREDTTRNGDQMIALMIDIAEGEHKGFYADRYNDARGRDPNAKWRGTFYQPTTNREGSANPFFKGLMTAIERSNPGYVWDWDERRLKGKKIGFIFREEEYMSQAGEVRVTVKPTWPRDVDTIRKGVDVPDIKRLNPQPAPAYQQPPAFSGGFQPVDHDDELPF